MKNPREIKGLMQAINSYLMANNLELPKNAEIRAGIDYFTVYCESVPVLEIADRPPTAIYEIHKTQYTDKYLRPQTAVAA